MMGKASQRREQQVIKKMVGKVVGFMVLAAALLGVSFFLPLGLSPIRPARGHR